MRLRSLLPLLIAILPGAATLVSAQGDGRQYLSAVMEPAARKQAAFYKVAGGLEAGLYKGSIYNMDGRLKAEGTYLDEALTIEHGEFVFYHANSKVESHGRYEHGTKSGVWKRFDSAGRPLTEKVYDPEPLANIIYTRAQTMPRSAQGGERELVRYLRDHAGTIGAKRVKGSVTTTFIVEKDGSLSEVKVIEQKGRAEQVTPAVLSALQATVPWEPGLEKGQPVRVRMRVPVQF